MSLVVRVGGVVSPAKRNRLNAELRAALVQPEEEGFQTRIRLMDEGADDPNLLEAAWRAAAFSAHYETLEFILRNQLVRTDTPSARRALTVALSLCFLAHTPRAAGVAKKLVLYAKNGPWMTAAVRQGTLQRVDASPPEFLAAAPGLREAVENAQLFVE